MKRENPCLTCGACCAYFRVSFYWGEADSSLGGTVPAELTEDLSPFYRCMKGTNQKNPRCIALEGEIGQTSICKIYDLRSTSCWEFGVHWENGNYHLFGEDLERCNRARAAWGLPPLLPRTPRFQHARPVLHHEPVMGNKIHMPKKKRRSRDRLGDSSM